MTHAMRAMAAVMLLAVGAACSGQGDAPAFPAIEERLAGFAGRMRLGLSIASVAVFSPTVADAHAQAERLIVLLRGDAKDKVAGLLLESGAVVEWIALQAFRPELKQELLGAAGNVQAFLRLALEAASSAKRDRALVNASQDLLRTYACLLAAWGQPVDGVVVPGVVLLLRAFDIPAPA